MTSEYRDLSRRIEDEVPKFAKGAKLMASFADALQTQGLLPEKLPEVSQVGQETQAPIIDLRQRSHDLLTKVRQPSEKEKEALGSVGYIFLPIEAKTLVQVVSEDPGYFRNSQLDYIKGLPKPDLREYIPAGVEIGFNPSQLFVPDSFGKSQSKQIEMTDDYSRNTVETEFPDARVLMLTASVLAQADRAYFKETGKVLFTNRYARALDQVDRSYVACVGRTDPDNRLSVNDVWVAGNGNGLVGVALLVVFLQK